MNKFYRFAAILLFVAALLLCAGCETENTLPTTTKPVGTNSVEKEKIDWSMTATVFNPTQGYSKTTTMHIAATYPLPSDELNIPIDIQFEMEKDSGYLAGTEMEQLHCWQSPQWGSGNIFSMNYYLYDISANASVRSTIALDWDKQCVIVLMEDYPGKYIVASNDPADTPEDILAHFDGFVSYWESKWSASSEK